MKTERIEVYYVKETFLAIFIAAIFILIYSLSNSEEKASRFDAILFISLISFFAIASFLAFIDLLISGIKKKIRLEEEKRKARIKLLQNQLIKEYEDAEKSRQEAYEHHKHLFYSNQNESLSLS